MNMDICVTTSISNTCQRDKNVLDFLACVKAAPLVSLLLLQMGCQSKHYFYWLDIYI